MGVRIGRDKMAIGYGGFLSRNFVVFLCNLQGVGLLPYMFCRITAKLKKLIPHRLSTR